MARAALNLSVREFARQAGMPATTLSRFENGQSIGADRIARLGAALEETGIIALAEDAEHGPGIRLAKGFRRGFIYDAEGKHVASILGQSVVDVARDQRVAVAKGDDVFTLRGEPLGTLGTVDIFNQAGSLPDTGLRLLTDARSPALLLDTPAEPSDVIEAGGPPATLP